MKLGFPAFMLWIFMVVALIEIPLFCIFHPIRAFKIVFLGDPDDELCP